MPIGKLPTAPSPSARVAKPSPSGALAVHVDYQTAFAMAMSAGAARGEARGGDAGVPAAAPTYRQGAGVDYMTNFFKQLNTSGGSASSTPGTPTSATPRGNRVYTQKPRCTVDAFTEFATTVQLSLIHI